MKQYEKSRLFDKNILSEIIKFLPIEKNIDLIKSLKYYINLMDLGISITF
jgi:hypothetical protein